MATTKKTTKRKAPKRAARKTTKRKAPKRNPSTKKTKRKAPRKTARKAPKRNPSHKTKAPRKNPESVTFKVGGRQPKPEAVKDAARTVLVILKTYAPVKVSSSKAFYPWLVRRGEKLDISRTMMLHAVCDLAERGKVSLYTDEDHVPSLAAADVKLLPSIGAAEEPLMWVVLR